MKVYELADRHGRSTVEIVALARAVGVAAVWSGADLSSVDVAAVEAALDASTGPRPTPGDAAGPVGAPAGFHASDTSRHLAASLTPALALGSGPRPTRRRRSDLGGWLGLIVWLVWVVVANLVLYTAARTAHRDSYGHVTGAGRLLAILGVVIVVGLCVVVWCFRHAYGAGRVVLTVLFAVGVAVSAARGTSPPPATSTGGVGQAAGRSMPCDDELLTLKAAIVAYDTLHLRDPWPRTEIDLVRAGLLRQSSVWWTVLGPGTAQPTIAQTPAGRTTCGPITGYDLGVS